MQEEYSEEWREPVSGEFELIGRTLVKNNITGCGEYYIKKSKTKDLFYLVACTRDGSTWDFHEVNADRQAVYNVDNIPFSVPYRGSE